MRRALILLGLVCLVLPGQALAARGPAGTAERLAEKTILDLEGVLEDAEENLADMSELPSVQAQDASACQTDSAEFDEPRYTGAGAADLEGDLYCFSAGIPSPVNIADRAYFLHTLGSRDFAVGDFQIGRATGINSIGLGFPVFDGTGEVTGITLSPLSLDWLQARTARRQSEKAVDTLIVDDHGTVLARSGEVPTADGTNLAGDRLVQSMLTEDFGHGRHRLAGSRVHSAWGVVPLSGGEIHVAVGVPSE
jgi:hypothetical protein